MKILKVKTSGFMLLEDGFEINFLNKARVNELDREDELIELKENLFIPTTTVFTGKNASGKTTILTMLNFISELFYSGRVRYDSMYFRDNKISFEVFFLLKDDIYKYKADFLHPENTIGNEVKYCYIENEELYSKKYYKSYGKNLFDDNFDSNTDYTSNVSDTSLLYELTRNKVAVTYLTANSNLGFSYIFDYFEAYKMNDLLLKIFNLFDENILNISYKRNEKIYYLDILGLGKKTFGEEQLNKFLSEGTKKGLTIFAFAILTLRLGNTIIIDEIENSFHKNLVENIIMIFNDKRINKNKANLIFSTHYVEILDLFRRRDNIYVMTKDKYITNRNIYLDYDGRTELLKSAQFNNNAFGTLINYEKLMDLKKRLINEIPNIT
jgi:AAA15 family ATPase/GTPase